MKIISDLLLFIIKYLFAQNYLMIDLIFTQYY